VLDALDLAKAHFWGYSMGGWIGFGMARYAPERVDRLVIGGSDPYARNQEPAREFYNAHLDDSADDFVTALEDRFGAQVSPARKMRLCNLDRRALLALSQDRPELSDMLSNMRMPCCLYAGEADPACEPAKSASARIPGALFFSLPGLNHPGAFRSSDRVVPRVMSFLRGQT
jgi:pimeloyl-ACP methyl ester carboxylesterase